VQEILNFEWRREIYTGRIGLDLPVQQPTLGQVHKQPLVAILIKFYSL